MNTFPSLVDKLYELRSELPNEVFLRQPLGSEWHEYSYDDVITEALKVVSGLNLAGLKKGDKIGIFSKNCHQWVVTEIAIMLGGFITVPFYSNLVGEPLKDIIELSEIKFLFIGKIDNWEKAKTGISEEFPIVKFGQGNNSANVDYGIDWDEFIKGVEPNNDNFRPKLDDIWAIFYTSGTTGIPKGAVMEYSAAANLWMSQDAIHNNFNLQGPGRNSFISYLPLNHIAEQTLIITGSIYNKGKVSFVESLYTFAKNLADAKPSVFLAVPTIWAKLKRGIIVKTPRLDALLRIPNTSEDVKKQIRVSLGLDNTKLVFSGASSLSSATIAWFKNIGINIRESYGMTESLAIVVLQPKDDVRNSKTGKILEEGEIKIDPETDEILVKNGWMFKEYYNEPELTKNSFDDKGFYRTSDTGELDADGYLKVNGRVNDTFKTMKGEFIVPAPIENSFADNNLIEQICVVGLELPQPIALVQLSEISKELSTEVIKQRLAEVLEMVNKDLHPHERLDKLVAISERWTLENGILTPTNKIKRKVIQSTYKHLYSGWINEKSKIILA